MFTWALSGLELQRPEELTGIPPHWIKFCTIRLTRNVAAFPNKRAAMLRRVMRQQKSGKIVNISSGTALNGSAGRIHYVTSKAGVIGFTRTLAREVGDDNINVNAIAPGSTLSEDNPTEEILKMRGARVGDRCLKRVQLPKDLVGTVLFLSSPLSDFMLQPYCDRDMANLWIKSPILSHRRAVRRCSSKSRRCSIAVKMSMLSGNGYRIPRLRRANPEALRLFRLD